MAMQPSAPRPLIQCSVCQGALKSVGRLPMRRDAAEAGVLATSQPGDPTPAVGLDVYRCHNCGRLEFYDHDFLLPSV
jgi:hypothetical protein